MVGCVVMCSCSTLQSTNSEAELKKAADEIKRLREEISTLRQENLQVKVCTVDWKVGLKEKLKHQNHLYEHFKAKLV